MDDCVILARTKFLLHNVLDKVKCFLHDELLELKRNYQIFSTGTRGIDFVGYRFFHNYTLLRKKSIRALRRLCYNIIANMHKGKMINYTQFCGINSYIGLLQYCNGFSLYDVYIESVKPAVFNYYKNRVTKKKSRYNRFINNFNSKKGVMIA